jgi:ribosome-associated protein YbcJ (S4-like RNA binding protein)
MTEFAVRGEFITLGQLLKATGMIPSGSDARAYLSEHTVLVNRAPESRRGRKLYPGDCIEPPGQDSILLRSSP